MISVDSPLIPHVVRALTVLGEENRIRIMILLHGGPLSVNELAAELAIPQPAVSRHLAMLREGGFIRARREGQRVYHEIADESIFTVCEVLCGSVSRRIEGLHRDIISQKKRTSQKGTSR